MPTACIAIYYNNIGYTLVSNDNKYSIKAVSSCYRSIMVRFRWWYIPLPIYIHDRSVKAVYKVASSHKELSKRLQV